MPLELWTTPRTWNAGEIVDASMMNVHVRDNLRHVLPGTLMAQAFVDIGTQIDTTSTSFVDLDTNNIYISGHTYSGKVVVMMGPLVVYAGAGQRASMNISADGAYSIPYLHLGPTGYNYVNMVGVFALTPGVHTFRPGWRSINGGTVSIIPYTRLHMTLWEGQP